MSDLQPILDYDLYNREERYLCSHLFRLLHEPADDFRPLRAFLGADSAIGSFRILAEVALIRDAYHARRPDPTDFMDAVTQMVMTQEDVAGCRIYSELPADLRSPGQTHPRQIMHKGSDRLDEGEKIVYGAIQGMFNAKPDLAICHGESLYVYEAKLTLGFDQGQLRRTRNIAAIWAKLLHRDLGFDAEPAVNIHTLGLSAHGPTISWERILEIAEVTYPAHDRTRLALARAITFRG